MIVSRRRKINTIDYQARPRQSGRSPLGRGKGLLAVFLFLLGSFTPGGLAQESQKIVLDGDGDYAQGPDSDALSFKGKSDRITIEAWVKHDGESDTDACIVDKYNDDSKFSGNYELCLVGSGDAPPVRFVTEGAHHDRITSRAGIPENRWTHVAVTDAGSNMRIYINGELDREGSADDDIFGRKEDPAFYIGSNEAGTGQFFSGEIDEVRVWKVERSQAQIRENRFNELTGSEAGLIAYYPFGAQAPTTDRAGTNGLSFHGDASAASSDVLPVPPDLYVEDESAGQVSLRWEQRTGPNDANEALGIRVYRSPYTGLSKRTRIAQQNAVASPTYVATSLHNGQTYFWEVTAVDPSGRESDYSPVVTGTPHDGSGTTPLMGGASLALDGNQDYATVGDRPSLSTVYDSYRFTLEAWIKHDGESEADASVIDKWDDDNVLDGGFELSLVGSGEETLVRFVNEDDHRDELTSNTGIPAGRWTHVALTHAADSMWLYINGELDAKGTADDQLRDNALPIRIGASEDGGSPFLSGRVDQVRLWNSVRTSQQIQSNYRRELVGNEDSLLAYWRFNDAFKNVLTDTSVGGATYHVRAVLSGDAAVASPGALPVPPRLYGRSESRATSLVWKQRDLSAVDNSVYRATSPDDDNRSQLVTQSASNTSYNDSGGSLGTNYFYQATTINGKGQEGDYGHPAPVTPSLRPLGDVLVLDGDQDYGTVGDRPSLRFDQDGDYDLSIEVWIKRDGNSDPDASLVDKFGNDGYELSLIGSGQNVTVEFKNAGAHDDVITSNATIPVSEWTHLAVTRELGSMKLYVNGKLDAQGDADDDVDDEGYPFRIGAKEDASGEFFSGEIDELRLWSDVRTGAEILQNYRRELLGDEQGLLGYWRFNETPGTPIARAAAERPKTIKLSGNADFTQSPIEQHVAVVSRRVSEEGRVDFDSTSVDVVFRAISGSGRVIAQKFGSVPDVPEGIDEKNISTYRFVLRAEGDLRFSGETEVRFDASTLDGIDNPDGVTVYKRDTTGSGPFAALSTNYDANTDELVVTTGSFSEFVFASDTNSLPTEDRAALPQTFVLDGNAPNPFRRSTTIRYALPKPVQVSLTVYDVLGRRIRTLVDEKQTAGRKQVRFEASGLAAGVYVVRMQAGDFTQTRRMVVAE